MKQLHINSAGKNINQGRLSNVLRRKKHGQFLVRRNISVLRVSDSNHSCVNEQIILKHLSERKVAKQINETPDII